MVTDGQAEDQAEVNNAAPSCDVAQILTITEESVADGEEKEIPRQAASGSPEDSTEPMDPASWRREVAARVHRYRSRRPPRGPRYPSLKLQFDTPASQWREDDPQPTRHSAATTREAVAVDRRSAQVHSQTVAADSTKVIQFPRSALMPPSSLDELAEPVPDRPRILEAPEIAPPPPALGGITIESEEREIDEKRPGIDIPLQSAPMLQRLSAVLGDSACVLSAVALFEYVFFKVTAMVPPLLTIVAASAGLTFTFWVFYQYALLVYTGSTPGLRLSKLRLSRFDGSPVSRSIRRWRVLVSVLSAISLGLGYAWYILDEDQLCWHDRITKTYLAPLK